jgi:hypothetical protein
MPIIELNQWEDLLILNYQHMIYLQRRLGDLDSQGL